MIPRQTLKAGVAAVGLYALSLLGTQLLLDTSQVHGQETMKSRAPVKYVVSVDYPVGGKYKYIAWVRSVAEDLKAPDEVRRITSYDD